MKTTPGCFPFGSVGGIILQLYWLSKSPTSLVRQTFHELTVPHYTVRLFPQRHPSINQTY